MRIRLYLDEDIPIQLARALRQRGVDILTTQEAEMGESTDEQQVGFAAEQQRTILTHNKQHFIKIHHAIIEKGMEHWGIIVADQNRIGLLLQMVSRLLFTVSAESMKNRLEFLSNWKTPSGQSGKPRLDE